MEFYYKKKLKIKRDRLLQNITFIKKLSVLLIKAIIKTDGRAQNILFIVDELEHPRLIREEQQPINKQLINFRQQFLNKSLYLIITQTFKEVVLVAKDYTQSTRQVAFKAINTKPVIINNLETLNILQAIIKKVWNKGKNKTKLI